MSTLLAVCIFLVVAADLYIGRRQYDKILEKLNQFQQIGVKVSMDGPEEQPKATGMTMRQKRTLLEKLSRERVEAARKARS